jgi:hypothetical protein
VVDQLGLLQQCWNKDVLVSSGDQRCLRQHRRVPGCVEFNAWVGFRTAWLKQSRGSRVSSYERLKFRDGSLTTSR